MSNAKEREIKINENLIYKIDKINKKINLIFFTVRKAKQNHSLTENFHFGKGFFSWRTFHTKKKFSYMCQNSMSTYQRTRNFLEAIRRYILELITLSNENITNEVIQDSSSTSDQSFSRSRVSFINIYIHGSGQIVYSQLIFKKKISVMQ